MAATLPRLLYIGDVPVEASYRKELSRSLQRLASDPAYRMRLARAALAAGQRHFAYAAAYETFSTALGKGARNARGMHDLTSAAREVS